VGLALLVVLEKLTPAERLAFVLHDLFGVPFTEIGPIVGRSPDAAKMLASRARRRARSGTAVAGRALLFSQPGAVSEHALVNGAAGVVTRRNGRLVAVLGFTIAHGKIVAIEVLADPDRLSQLG
jgi:Sigma-70, region 4